MNFKPDDWVIHPEAKYPWQITQNSLDRLDNTLLQFWQPQRGDWVVIKPRHPHMHQEISFHVKQFLGNNCNGVDIEPFIGNLPSFLQN